MKNCVVWERKLNPFVFKFKYEITLSEEICWFNQYHDMTDMVVILAHIISKSIHILMCTVTFISFLIKLVVPFYHPPPPPPILKMGHIVLH